jgi:hypothetical protein
MPSKRATKRNGAGYVLAIDPFRNVLETRGTPPPDLDLDLDIAAIVNA